MNDSTIVYSTLIHSAVYSKQFNFLELYSIPFKTVLRQNFFFFFIDNLHLFAVCLLLKYRNDLNSNSYT